jgi:hypothetical protein
MLVTFIFKLPNDNTKYFGKLIADLSDDYDEGLDREIKEIVFSKVPSVNKNKVKIGILSCERKNWEYFSKDERYVFDLLYIEHRDHHEIYINFINNENDFCYESNDTSTYESSSICDEDNILEYEKISTEDENSSTEDENSSTEDENSSTEDEERTEDEDSSTEDKYLRCECCNDICSECKILDLDVD